MKYLKTFENLYDFENPDLRHIEHSEELPDDMEEDDDSNIGIYYHISDFSETADKHRRPNGVLRRSQFELTL